MQDGQSPLWVASYEGHEKCVELLIEADAKINLQSKVYSSNLIIVSLT